MDIHVPVDNTAGAVATLVGTITKGLDAVVIAHEVSTIYEDSVHLTLAGNARDIAIAVDRASKFGGVVD